MVLLFLTLMKLFLFTINLMNEEEEQSLDERGEMCLACGCVDFFYDVCTWEATCRNCGIVTSYEICTHIDYFRPKTYFKHNYFTNTILKNAMERGFKISRFDMVEMERRYKLCVNKFNATKSIHKRKYFINSNFVLGKISESLGKDVTMYIKLPKNTTLKRLEEDWVHINPF